MTRSGVSTVRTRVSSKRVFTSYPFRRVTQVEGLEGVAVGYNSTGADDSCQWFVTFTDSPGNLDQVESRYAVDGLHTAVISVRNRGTGSMVQRDDYFSHPSQQGDSNACHIRTGIYHPSQRCRDGVMCQVLLENKIAPTGSRGR